MPARGELGEVQHARLAEQCRRRDAIGRSRLRHEALDLLRVSARHRRDRLALEQGGRHRQIEVRIGLGRCVPGRVGQLAAHGFEQRVQVRDQDLLLEGQQDLVIGGVDRLQQRIRRHVQRQVLHIDGAQPT